MDMVNPTNISNVGFNSKSHSLTSDLLLENSTNGLSKIENNKSPIDVTRNKIEVKKERKSSILPNDLSLSSSFTSSTSVTTVSKDPHQHDPILKNEDGSMLTTPQHIPIVITKDQNKLIHLDPVPNFQDKSEIKLWLQKFLYPLGIEIVIERSDNTKVIFKCKASKRGRKSRKSSVNGTLNTLASTFEDTVKECAEKFFIHDNVTFQRQNSMNMKTVNGLSNLSTSSATPQQPINPSSSLSQSPRVKKKRAVSRFNVCPFRIRATYSLKRRKWSIVVVNNIHSHELTFNPNSVDYRKFKAKLREDNDIEAIKKFDELEYRKRSNLSIQNLMIPCDCGLTNEIESFNIVIPNVGTTRTTKTPSIFNNIPSNYNNSHHKDNSDNSLNTINIPTINNKKNGNNNDNNNNNNKRITISDLIMQKNKKGGNLEMVKNIKLNGGIQEKLNNYSNVNPLYRSIRGNNNNNNNNGSTDRNYLSILYGLNNNDSDTEIIRAKEVIHDEENDEELGNIIQGVDDDGYNNVIANEYYHNDFNSYNTDIFYKFNGPFDSGNIILSNDHSSFINNIINRNRSIYKIPSHHSNMNKNNFNNNNDSISANIRNSDNSMNTATATNNSNTVGGNLTMDNDLLLTNNFIDDPVLSETHLNMMNHHAMNLLELQFDSDDHITTNINNNNNNSSFIDLNEIDFTNILFQ